MFLSISLKFCFPLEYAADLFHATTEVASVQSFYSHC